MRLLNKIIFLLLLAGFYNPSFAAVDGFEPATCSVFSAEEGDKKEGDEKKEGEEEPDCE